MIQPVYKRYNRERYYEEKILPIISELKKACSKENLHMFCAVSTVNNKQGTTYRCAMIDGLCPIEITKNKIPDLVKVMIDFDPHDDDFEPPFKRKKISKLVVEDGYLQEPEQGD